MEQRGTEIISGSHVVWEILIICYNILKIWVKARNGAAEVTVGQAAKLYHLPFLAPRGHVVTKVILLSAHITFPDLSF